MNIAVDGDNFFYTGWLARLLGLPRTHPSAPALKPEAIAAFLDGWDTCEETPLEVRLIALDGMKALGQAHVVWVNDDNNELV